MDKQLSPILGSSLPAPSAQTTRQYRVRTRRKKSRRAFSLAGCKRLIISIIVLAGRDTTSKNQELACDALDFLRCNGLASLCADMDVEPKQLLDLADDLEHSRRRIGSVSWCSLGDPSMKNWH